MQIIEYKNGTVLCLVESRDRPAIATANKDMRMGWRVRSHKKSIWQSVRNPKVMVACRFVNTKNEAIDLLNEVRIHFESNWNNEG